jgi:hypothetical protein
LDLNGQQRCDGLLVAQLYQRFNRSHADIG